MRRSVKIPQISSRMCNGKIHQTPQSHIPRQGQVLPLGPSQTSWNPLPHPSKSLIFPLFNIPFLCISVSLCAFAGCFQSLGDSLEMLFFHSSPRNFPSFSVGKFPIFPAFLGQTLWLLPPWELGMVMGLKLYFNTWLDKYWHEKKSLDVEITHDLRKN